MVNSQDINSLLQNNLLNLQTQPLQNTTLQPVNTQQPFLNLQGNQYGSIQQLLNNQNNNWQQSQSTQTQSIQYNNLLNQLLGPQNNLSNNNLNTLMPQVNNPQNNNLNILQLLGLQQSQQNASLGSFVTNEDMNRNTPTLQNSLYPSQFNLYGRSSYQKPSVAEELTAVGIKSLINFATPKWAQNTFKQDENQQLKQRYENFDQDNFNDSVNNKRRNQKKNRNLKFKIEDQFIQLSKEISGNENLAAYLQFLDNFDKSNFKGRNQNRLSNCDVLKQISPLDQINENLKECLIMHMYANLNSKKVCFIFSCRNYDQQILFYQICGKISPLELEAFNLDKKIIKNRLFRKSKDPKTFMTNTQFSLDKSIDCTNSSDILKDYSLVNVLDKFAKNQLQFNQQWQNNYIISLLFFYFLQNYQEINFMQ